MRTLLKVTALVATLSFSTVALAQANDSSLVAEADETAPEQSTLDLTHFAQSPEDSASDAPVETTLEGVLDDIEAEAGAEAEGDSPGLPGGWGENATGYRGWLVSELERLGDYDLYGVSAQLPAGYLKFKWDYGWLSADSRFNGQGERGPVLNPLQFDLNGETQIDVLLDVTGGGNGHTFQSSYGITDPFDWYVEVPFTAMNLNLNPTVRPVDDAGNYIGEAAAGLLGVTDRAAYNAETFLYETLPALGRPAPAVGYDGSWLLGDINTGFSWNFFRNSRFSSALTNRVFLPTGHIPSAETSLTYATGPQPDIGIGSWGVSSTSGYDLRLFKHSYWVDIILSQEIGFGYFFKQQRDYPTNFVEPNPLAAQLDPATFPDLSHLDGSFEYTPGFNTSWSSQLNIQLAIFGIGVGYGWRYSQEPVVDGDPDFISMVNAMELFGDQAVNEFQVGLSANLLPLYIPANIGITRRVIVGGRNTLAWSNFWQFSVEAFVPMYLLWDRDRGREE